MLLWAALPPTVGQLDLDLGLELGSVCSVVQAEIAGGIEGELLSTLEVQLKCMLVSLLMAYYQNRSHDLQSVINATPTEAVHLYHGRKSLGG